MGKKVILEKQNQKTKLPKQKKKDKQINSCKETIICCKKNFIFNIKICSEKIHNLFSSSKENKIKSLMKSIDYTNYRYGRSTLSLADAGLNKKWNMRRKYSSKINTTDFYRLPTIKAI